MNRNLHAAFSHMITVTITHLELLAKQRLKSLIHDKWSWPDCSRRSGPAAVLAAWWAGLFVTEKKRERTQTRRGWKERRSLLRQRRGTQQEGLEGGIDKCLSVCLLWKHRWGHLNRCFSSRCITCTRPEPPNPPVTLKKPCLLVDRLQNEAVQSHQTLKSWFRSFTIQWMMHFMTEQVFCKMNSLYAITTSKVPFIIRSWMIYSSN